MSGCDVKKFSVMWKQMFTALEPEKPSPAMMKKDGLVVGLKQALR